MVGFKLCLLLVGVALVNGASVSRVQLDNYERFLRNSVHGEYQDALTPELEALQNTWERSGKFEGDIILDEDQIQGLLKEYAGHRNALLNSNRYWPNGVVYYTIESGYFTSAQVAAIEQGLRDLEAASCLRFVKRTTQSNYIRVIGSQGGCFSSVGMVGGAQTLNLQPYPVGSGCFRIGTIVHEFLHAVGFYHMQSTWNRDEWVEIIWDKIQSGTEHNFNKYTSSQVTNFDVEYDYGSVLHYGLYGFSIDGSKTMEPLKPTNEIIGQRDGMSKGDIRKLNLLYKCYTRN